MASHSKIDIGGFGALRAFADSERVREWFSVALITALATAMLWRCLIGDWPVGHDHPVHLFRIWQFGQALAHHPFSPWIWSHRWFAGYPQNVVYPIGADLLVLALRILSFGFLKLGPAYGVAFWLFYTLYGYATYYFVREALRSRIAALTAVVFLLTDPGSNDVGGWFFTVDIGVWAAPLGAIAGMFALVQLSRLFDEVTSRRIAFAGIYIGLALLCHPLHILFLLIAVPLIVLSRYLAGELTVSWRSALLAIAAAGLIGGLIASYWLVPYVASSKYALEIGDRGKDLQKIGNDLIAGHFFDRMNALAAALGLIGSLCLLRARKTLPLFMGLFTFATLILSSSTFAHALGARAETWLAHHVISSRLYILLKPFWFGAAAYVIVLAAGGFRILSDRRRAAANGVVNSIPKIGRIVVAVVLIGPLAYYALSSFWRGEVRRPTIWHSQRNDAVARAEFVAWMRDELDRQPGFFRIAHGFDWIDHDLADLAIDIPVPFYQIGSTPTGHFRSQIAFSTNAAFRATNVRFALSRKPLAARPDFRLVKIFDQKLWLYEFRDWKPQPFEINGSGGADLVEFDEHDIVLRADANARGNLRLNVSYYPKWRATRDGIAVPIHVLSVPGVENSAFMQVPLEPGEYRFHYKKGFFDYIGTVMAIVGLGACVAMFKWPAFSRYARPLIGRFEEYWRRRSKNPPSAEEQAAEDCQHEN